MEEAQQSCYCSGSLINIQSAFVAAVCDRNKLKYKGLMLFGAVPLLWLILLLISSYFWLFFPSTSSHPSPKFLLSFSYPVDILFIDKLMSITGTTVVLLLILVLHDSNTTSGRTSWQVAQYPWLFYSITFYNCVPAESQDMDVFILNC